MKAVARYCSAPKMIHWKAALGILGYAVRTSSFGITFQRGTVEGFHLVSFADADYASKATDRRSVPGGVVMCAGGAVSCSEMRHAVNHAGRVCSYVGCYERDFVFGASLAFHVAEGRYTMHSFV